MFNKDPSMLVKSRADNACVKEVKHFSNLRVGFGLNMSEGEMSNSQYCSLRLISALHYRPYT